MVRSPQSPKRQRWAIWSPSRKRGDTACARHARRNSSRSRGGSTPSTAPTNTDALLTLLAHPNIASKHWIIRQYDHEVQGNTVLRPLVGAGGKGPGDASVIEPVPGTGRGLAIGCGLATGMGDPAAAGDPYLAAIAGIDECIRNLVCVGADPARVAILDNFCWPSCTRPENLGSLVRAAEGCYDGAKAYRTPFVSGKDSLNNQFTIPGENGQPGRTIEIPPTLLITGIGIVPSLEKCITMDAKRAGNILVLVGETTGAMGGSHYAQMFGTPAGGLTTDPDSLMAEVERRAAGVLAGVPAGPKKHAQALIRSLTPTAMGKLDQLVSAFGPRASETAKLLATRLGNPAIEKLAGEIGPEKVQDLLRIVATAAEAQGLTNRMPAFDPTAGARTARARRRVHRRWPRRQRPRLLRRWPCLRRRRDAHRQQHRHHRPRRDARRSPRHHPPHRVVLRREPRPVRPRGARPRDRQAPQDHRRDRQGRLGRADRRARQHRPPALRRTRLRPRRGSTHRRLARHAGLVAASAMSGFRSSAPRCPRCSRTRPSG
ncbi:MAG: hypothetical protein HND58_06000 [Planctomycetota bacterium]|nr:MAG: hypothetical protein HND58_06000 [Planctomycetota bacterium]